MTGNKPISDGREINLFGLGLALAVFYWLGESLLHVFVFDNLALLDALLERDDPNEFWMRLVIVFLLGGISYFAEHVRLREKQSRQHEQKVNQLLRFLSDVNQHVHGCVDQQVLLDFTCNSAVDVGGYRVAWIGLKTGDDFKLRAWASADQMISDGINNSPHPVSLFSCICSQNVLREGVAERCQLNSKQGCSAPWLELFLKYDYRHTIILPLTKGGQTTGIFQVYTVEVGSFSVEEIAILNEAAENISTAMGKLLMEAERKQLVEKLDLRIRELERFQKATVQREFRIKELRDLNAELQQQIATMKNEKP